MEVRRSPVIGRVYSACGMLPTSPTAKAGWYYFLENFVYFSDSLEFSFSGSGVGALVVDVPFSLH